MSADVVLPHRWDLVSPDQLGSLLDGVPAPDLWFAPELTRCAGRVLARSGGGPVYFVGRSLDSVFDLLSGATDGDDRLRRLPFSGAWTFAEQRAQWTAASRAILADCGLTPAGLARSRRPVALADVVSSGSTFALLYTLLREWVDETREPWDVVRRKLRFVGMVRRGRTSPNAWRWQQHARWTADLPARAVVNVSAEPDLYRYLADNQVKTTDSFGPAWPARHPGPHHDARTRQALAEAVALVEYGRRAQTRAALLRAVTADPTGAATTAWRPVLAR